MKLKELLNKIKEYYLRRKTFFTWMVGLGLVITLIIVALIPRDENPPFGTLIDVPFQYYKQVRVDIPEKTVENFELEDERLKIYDIDMQNRHELVDNFLVDIGVSGMQKTEVDEKYYQWKKGEDIVQYDQYTETLYFKFEESVTPLGLSQGFVGEEELNEYFEGFVQTYINKSFSYDNFDIEKERGQFRIMARRLVEGGYPLEISGYDSYTDYLIIEDDGDIKEGRLLLVTYSDYKAVRLNVVTPDSIETYTNSDLYPKEVNQGFAELISGRRKSRSSVSGHFTEYEIEFPKVKDIEIKEIEIVYFFASTYYAKLIPAYKLTGESNVSYEGGEFLVPVVIYSNAMDPNFVYVPSEEEEYEFEEL